MTTIGNSRPLAWWIDIKRTLWLSSSVVAACSSRGGLSRSLRKRATKSASVKLSWRSKSRASCTSLRVLASLREPRNSQTKAASKPDSSSTAATRSARGTRSLTLRHRCSRSRARIAARRSPSASSGISAGSHESFGQAAGKLACQPEQPSSLRLKNGLRNAPARATSSSGSSTTDSTLTTSRTSCWA